MMVQKLFSEFLGTLLLVAGVVGSGIMAEQLSAGIDGLALLANTLATGAILFVIITIFGPLSGAHFNPAVSLVMALNKKLGWKLFALYVLMQILGGISGSFLVHIMFEQPIIQLSSTARSGIFQYLSEAVASFGLLITIFLGQKHKAEALPMLVALYITSAYWFTASTSFANPAVTLARTFSDSFSGIYYGDTGFFICAQIAGAIMAFLVARFLNAAK